MAQLFVNNFESTLAAGIASGATSLTVKTDDGAKVPAIAAPDFCLLTLDDGVGITEIVKASAHTSGSDAFTVERAQEGTTARAWSAGAVIELRVTAGTLAAFPAITGARAIAVVATMPPSPDPNTLYFLKDA